MKFIVYNSEFYYPSAEEFGDYVEAMKAFSKLKEERMDTVKNERSPYFDKDYLCIVIDEVDIKELQKLQKFGNKLDKECHND